MGFSVGVFLLLKNSKSYENLKVERKLFFMTVLLSTFTDVLLKKFTMSVPFIASHAWIVLDNVPQLFAKLKAPLSQYESLRYFLPESRTPFSTPMTDRIPPSESSRTPTPAITPISTTAQTYESVQPPRLRPDRPALVVSSTSWTPDEDFGILLEALKRYEQRARELAGVNGEKRLPKMLMVVTGKGPQREEYMKEINRLQTDWRWVRCLSIWLEAEDYPTFLGKIV